MNDKSRRIFLLQVAGLGSAFAASHVIAADKAPALVNLTEADATGSALGYKLDSTKVDQKKYPNHLAAQKCNGCTLYLGKAKDTVGPCSLYPGKQVTANGWCSAWVKKA